MRINYNSQRQTAVYYKKSSLLRITEREKNFF